MGEGTLRISQAPDITPISSRVLSLAILASIERARG